MDESEYTRESECHEGGQELYTFQRQRKIMPSIWEGAEIEKINRIPEVGIDGLKIYELNTTASTSNNKQELLKDSRMCVTQTVKDPTDVKMYSVNIELLHM